MTLSPLFFFFTLLFGLKVSLVTADWMYLMPVYPSQQQQEQSMQSHMLATDPYSYYHVPHQPANDHQQIPAPLIVLLPTQTARTPIIPDQQEDMIEQRSSLPFLESAAKATVRSSPTNVKVGGSGFWSFLRGTSLNNDVADRLFPFTIRIATHGEPHMPIVKVGHSPFTLGAGLWGKPELNYGKHVHHHPHSLPSPPALDAGY